MGVWCGCSLRRGSGSASGLVIVWTLFHSFAFDFSVWELWGALLHGGAAGGGAFEVSRSPLEFLALLVRERVTVLCQTPSAFYQLWRPNAGPARCGTGVAVGGVRWRGAGPGRLREWYAGTAMSAAAGEHVRHHRDDGARHRPGLDADRARPGGAADRSADS